MDAHADGSTLSLKKQTGYIDVVPSRERTNGGGKDTPPEPSESKIETYILVKTTREQFAVVWYKEFHSAPGDQPGLAPRFQFWDAEVIGDRAYILYSESVHTRLDIAVRVAKKAWRTVKSEDVPNVHFPAITGHVLYDSSGLRIRLVGDGERADEWDVIDPSLRKRKH